MVRDAVYCLSSYEFVTDDVSVILFIFLILYFLYFYLSAYCPFYRVRTSARAMMIIIIIAGCAGLCRVSSVLGSR